MVNTILQIDNAYLQDLWDSTWLLFIYLVICIALLIVGRLTHGFAFLHERKTKEGIPSLDQTNDSVECASIKLNETQKKAITEYKISNCQGIGKRQEQQDAFGFSPMTTWEKEGFFAVLCDGMGGLDSGAVIANSLVTATLADDARPAFTNPKLIPTKLEEMTAKIYQQYLARGGATMVTCYVHDDKLVFSSVGDSDLFLLRDGRLYAMNERQEYGNSLMLKAAKCMITIDVALEDEDAPALVHFMGAEKVVSDYSHVPFPVRNGDVYLMCSDGISDSLSGDELREAMLAGTERCCEILEKMIHEKNLSYQDNYTAIAFEMIHLY